MSEQSKENDWWSPYGKPIEMPVREVAIRLVSRTKLPDVPKMTTERCACRRYLLREGEATCWNCQSESADKKEFMADAMTPITRADVLEALIGLADSDDPESAHGWAEMLILRLLGDEAIAAAFYAVPKWYA